MYEKQKKDVLALLFLTVSPEKMIGVSAALNHVHRYGTQELDYMGDMVFVFVVCGSGVRVEQEITGS